MEANVLIKIEIEALLRITKAYVQNTTNTTGNFYIPSTGKHGDEKILSINVGHILKYFASKVDYFPSPY